MRSFWEIDIKDLYSQQLKGAAEAAQSFFNKMGAGESEAKEHTERSNESLREQKGILEDLREAAVEFFAVEKVWDWGKEMIADGAHMETMRIQFQGLTGDVEKGNEAFENLTGLYKDFPLLGKQNIMEAGQQLEKVKVPIDALKQKLYEFGALSLGDGSKMQELAAIYSRSFASGFVNTRMLLNQPALLQEIEKMVGKNSVAFRKYAATGQVSIGILDDALQHLTSQGGQFSGMLEKMTNTTEGKWAHAKMELEEMGERLFEDIKPFLNGLIDTAEKWLPDIEKAFKFIGKEVKNLFDFYENNKELIDGLVIGMGLYVGAITAAESAMWLLDAATDANPIGIIALGLGALFVAYDKANFGATTLLDNLQDIKTWFEEAGTWMGKVWDDMGTHLSGIGDLLKGAITFDWDLMKKGRQEMGVDSSGDYLAERTKIDDQLVQQRMKRDNDAHRIKGLVTVSGSWGDDDTPETHSAKDDKKPNGYSALAPAGIPIGASGENGGAQGKNIIIHIQKLIGIENLHTSTVKESYHEIEEAVEKIMLGIVNDAEVAM